MTSEVGHECAARRPAELGTSSADTDATQKETGDDLLSATGADIAKTTSDLASSAACLGVTGNSLLAAADRMKEKLYRATEGEDVEDKRSKSGFDDDLVSRENSLRGCATQHHQQVLPVSRSQYHSIQQLSRPSINVAQTTASSHSHHLFGAECSYQLDNDSAELYRHSSGQAQGSADVPAGRYFVKDDRLLDDANSETQSQETSLQIRQDYDETAQSSDSDDGDEGSACTEFDMDYDECQTDTDRCGIDGLGQKAAVEVTSKAWSSEARHDGGVSSAVEDELEAKRARVEHIVRSMQTPPSDGQPSSLITAGQTTQQQHLIDGRRQRRKQFAPLQHQHEGRRSPHLKHSYVTDDDDSDREVDDTWSSQLDTSERDALRLGLQRVQDRLADMHNKYVNYLDVSGNDDVIVDVGNNVRTDEPIKRVRDNADVAVIGADFNRNEILSGGDNNDAGSNDGSGSGNLEALARMLKAEISDSVGNMVDEIVRSFVARRLKVAGSGGGGVRRHDEPADGRLTPTHRSTMSTTSSPDTHLTTMPRTDSDTASSGAIPPPLTPIRTSTAVDLRFPVLPPAAPTAAGIPAGSVEAMERAAAAAAKLVADRYSLQSAAAMAAYLDNAFLLHGKTAFEMPPSQATSSSTSPASVSHHLFTPTPYYPPQHSALQSHLIKVNIFLLVVYDLTKILIYIVQKSNCYRCISLMISAYFILLCENLFMASK